MEWVVFLRLMLLNSVSSASSISWTIVGWSAGWRRPWLDAVIVNIIIKCTNFIALAEAVWVYISGDNLPRAVKPFLMQEFKD